MPPTAPRPGDAHVGILYDESMERHIGPEHYERPQRIIRVFETLRDEGLLSRCYQLPARGATDAELLQVHPQEHIDKVQNLYGSRDEDKRGDAFITAFGDLYACDATATAARFAAGCVVEAVQRVLSGAVGSALAVVRPPGHHAECARAMGFCFYNNCAVAARAALAHPGGTVRRVLVLDWDVHHGNGIQDALWGDPSVLYISIHRHPKNFYPFCAGFPEEVGEGAGKGFNVNVPWHVKGAGDADYRAAFELVVEPIVRSFCPDLTIVAAGYDAAAGDPLGGCAVSPAGYFEMTRRLAALSPGGRLVLALEGGYNNRVTADCAAACVRALLGDDAAASSAGSASEDSDAGVEDFFAGSSGGGSGGGLWPLGPTGKMLKEVAKIQAPYWPVLLEGGPFDATWDAYLDGLRAGQAGRARAPPRGAAAGAAFKWRSRAASLAQT